MGRGRGLSADKQSGAFSTPTAGGQEESVTVEALKQQIRIMEQQVGALKERIRDKEQRGSKSQLTARVLADRCTGCRMCLDVCPRGAVSFAGSVAHIQVANCRGCGRCVEACPQEAIVLTAL